MLTAYDLAETLHKIITESEELHGIKSECDESSPEVTLYLMDGQVFNLAIKKIR